MVLVFDGLGLGDLAAAPYRFAIALLGPVLGCIDGPCFGNKWSREP